MAHWAFKSLLILPFLFSVANAAEMPAPSIPSAKAHKSLLLDVAKAGKRLVAVGERGHIILSDDSGASWKQAVVPVRSLLTAVYFVDERTGWAVGHESVVLATTDAGQTWELQNYKPFKAVEAGVEEAPLDDESTEDMYLDDEFADDSARTVGSREGVPLLDVWFADRQEGIAVGAYGLMLRTNDGGKTWLDVSNSVKNLDGWHFNAVAGLPGKNQTVLIAGEKGTLYRSSDGGRSFVPAQSPYGGSFFGAIGSSDGSLYVFGLQGSFFRSVDSGANWTRIETGITSGLNDGCQSADGRLYITGNAGVLLSENGQGGFDVEKRPDRQSVLSCASTGNGLVLVGDGGAKPSSRHAKQP